VGLTYLLDVIASRPQLRIRVYGEEKKLAAVRDHLFHPSLFPVDPPFESVVLPASIPVSGRGVVTHFPLDHPGGSRGYRLDLPHASIAFVTDTTAQPEAAYVRQIRGVDLLVHECNFMDGQQELSQVTGHSCTTAVAQVAAEAQVEQLVLIHLNPLYDDHDPTGIEAARSVFPHTTVAGDGAVIDF
jgi:phosphoribosyl 1,2-cyclic phosphodiesterase